MNLILSLLHGLDFTITCFFIGTVVFRNFIANAAGAASAQLTPLTSALVLRWTTGLLLLSIVWMILVAADMAGSFLPTEMKTVFTDTSFGKVCGIRILTLLAILLGAVLQKTWPSWLTFLLPFSFSFSGHATAANDHSLLLIADAAHVIAVSVWTGGLLNLVQWLSRRVKLGASWTHTLSSQQVIKRFSHFAMVSTAVILISGFFTAYAHNVKLLAPWATPYGQLLSLKLGLFACALLAASVNQFIHLRRWESADEARFSLSVLRELRIELGLVVLVFVLTGFLTRLDLPM